jgi:hypothetical protein
MLCSRNRVVLSNCVGGVVCLTGKLHNQGLGLPPLVL